MMRHISIILIGALFGAGLALSGMLNPSKVAGFLDLFGTWDPSLAFVMGSGATISLFAHRMAQRRAPLLAEQYAFPPTCEFGTDGKSCLLYTSPSPRDS